MSPSLLPPRGIFVPTRMIFDTQLPAAVLVTWIQLRSLAWAGWTTPPLSLSELASLTGIHPPRLTRHLSQLQDLSALSWRSAGHGKVIVSFPEEPGVLPENHSEAQNHACPEPIRTRDQASPDTHSYFPNQILGYLSTQDDQRGPFGDDRPDLDLPNDEAMGELQCDVEKGFSYYQNRTFERVTKLHHRPSQINTHSSHTQS